MSESAPGGDASQSSSGSVTASSGSGSPPPGGAGGLWSMWVGAVGMVVLFLIALVWLLGGDPLQFARVLLTSLAPFVVFCLVILAAARYEAVAVVVALAGVVVTAGGLWYLVLALSPENRSNQWYELGVGIGTAGALAGGVLVALGLWTGTIAAKRKRARSFPAPRP